MRPDHSQSRRTRSSRDGSCRSGCRGSVSHVAIVGQQQIVDMPLARKLCHAARMQSSVVGRWMKQSRHSTASAARQSIGHDVRAGEADPIVPLLVAIRAFRSRRRSRTTSTSTFARGSRRRASSSGSRRTAHRAATGCHTARSTAGSSRRMASSPTFQTRQPDADSEDRPTGSGRRSARRLLERSMRADRHAVDCPRIRHRRVNAKDRLSKPRCTRAVGLTLTASSPWSPTCHGR